MILIDSLLLAPFRGVLWVAEQINDAAREQRATEAETVTEELRQLYLDLESGHLTEDEFASREQRLLDRLDELGNTDAEGEGAAEDSEWIEDEEGGQG